MAGSSDLSVSFLPPHSWNCEHPLNHDTALEYFAHKDNPFWDRESNNAFLMQQGVVGAQALKQLRKMTGLEYALARWHEPGHVPSVYVICKQHRVGPTDTQVRKLAFYYIAGFPPVIFQAPDMHSIVSARLDVSAYQVLAAHRRLAVGVRHVPAQGLVWQFGGGAGAGAGAAEGRPSDASGSEDAERSGQAEDGDGNSSVGKGAGAGVGGCATAAGDGAGAKNAKGRLRPKEQATVVWTRRRQAQHTAMFSNHRDELFTNARAVDAILAGLERGVDRKRKEQQDDDDRDRKHRRKIGEAK